ncbi:MAG: phosphopantothenoylcysteine decarboxylase, partial [Actinomycetota bacterium]|nr:phosphopantothenoylcysteine decarboxylase [Actinomycetota bacterium]
ADVVVMAAAVADYRPAERLATKRKKTDALSVDLVQNPDILRELVAARRPGQVLVGFAAETGDDRADVLTHGREKLARKGCDLLVVNEVGESGHPTGFEGSDNAATVLAADGSATEVPLGSKDALADVVWDLVAVRL